MNSPIVHGLENASVGAHHFLSPPVEGGIHLYPVYLIPTMDSTVRGYRQFQQVLHLCSFQFSSLYRVRAIVVRSAKWRSTLSLALLFGGSTGAISAIRI